MRTLLKLIGNHRSIRKYTDQSIDDKTLKEVLTNAQFASTSSYVQAYSIIRVKNPDNRRQLAHLCGDQKYVEAAPEFLVFCADLNRLKKASEIQGMKSQEGFVETFIIATVDVALYGQNVMLGAESLGLGGVFIGGIRNHPVEVSELLKIPANVYPVFGMCLGYPNQAPEQKPRLPLDLILKEETYEDDDETLLKAYDDLVKAYYIRRTRGKVEHSWTEQMAHKMQGELRPHMKVYLEKWNLNKR